jgi:agmatine deiminase
MGDFVISRRAVVVAGLTAGLFAGLSGCAEADQSLPAKPEGASSVSEFEMPLESAPHERTFMQWPVSLDVYDPPSLRAVQSKIALIANSIARFEPVVMLAGSAHAESARAALGAEVEIWDIPTDDLWCRDSGPTFVKDDAGALAVAHLKFNGWGNKQAHSNDGQIAGRIAKRLGLPLIDTGLVGEQGGVEHDGAGTFLAHASCWVNPNRNAAPQAEIEAKLLQALGGTKMIWAPGVIGKDITDYHIDALARFVAPGRVLIQLPAAVDPNDPWSRSAFETYDILKSARGADGRKLEIIVIPEPVNIRATADDFVASYVNYYVCNGAVISAEFGDDKADQKAHDILASLYPGREIVSLNVDAIGEAGGGIHCATQQQPAGGEA